MIAGSPAIEVRDLVKRYDGRRVVDGASFSVARGEVLALLGPNGAGKTTTVEILEGFRRADAGEARILGEDPLRGGVRLRARVGIMLQGGGGIDPRTSVGAVIRLHAALFREPRDPDRLLELTGLARSRRTAVRRLSGGERQRLAFALALVGRPELLILDEPTAGMDPAARLATMRIVREEQGAGVTVLLTTHDLRDVDLLADRVAILHRGRIVASGTPGEIARPGVSRLRFRLSRPFPLDGLAAALHRVRPDARLVSNDAGGHAVEGTDADPALVAEIARWCAERDLLVSELRTDGGTLEERYLELTGDAAARGAGDQSTPPGAGDAR